MGQRKHWPEIDWLYTFGALLVIIGHSHSSDWNTFQGTVLSDAIVLIYTFHMPLFFAVAGFLFWNSDSFSKTEFGVWIKQKALRLLTPYVFWTTVALLPKYLLEHGSLAGLTPGFLLRNYFFPRENIWGHLWFIPVMLLAYLCFGLLRVLLKRLPDAAALGGSLSAALLFRLLPVNTGFLGLADARRMFLFFALGMCVNALMRKRQARSARAAGQKAVPIAILAGCGGASALLWTSAQNRPWAEALLPILIIAALWALARLLPPSRTAAWVSNNNFTIYLFSWFFQAAALWCFERLAWDWRSIFWGMLLAGALGSVLTALAAARLPFLQNSFFQRIFGARQR